MQLHAYWKQFFETESRKLWYKTFAAAYHTKLVTSPLATNCCDNTTMEGADVNRNQSEGNLELLCMAPLRGTHTLWFLVVCNTFLAVGAFAGNAVILAALYKESSIHLPSKILLGTLALTDFCVGLILEPLFVTFLLTIEFGGGRSLCHHVITITYITGLFLSSVSLSTLTQISVRQTSCPYTGLKV